MAGEGRVRGSWAYDTHCVANPPERPLISIFSRRMGRRGRKDPSSQSSPAGWGEEVGTTPHLNLLPQDGEKR